MLHILEPVAALLGVCSVYLMAKQRPIAWPIGLLMVLLYIVIFYQARLYSEMCLQIIYAFLQVYGWQQWMRSGDASALKVSRLAAPHVLAHLVLAVFISTALGFVMAFYTQAQMPWLDAALTGFSLVAQYWMAKKILYCWPLWIVLDGIYIGMFSAVNLYFTALLYGVLIAIACFAWYSWRNTMRHE